MGMLSEAEVEGLLAQARQGNTSALGKLLETYRSYLGLLARLQIGRRLQGKVDAADLVQETFLKAHANFGQFQGQSESTFVAWLRQLLASRLAKLVRHYCGTKRRDVRLERRLADELDQSSRNLDQSLAALDESPGQRAARREQILVLAAALDQLPAHYREVLVLHHLQDLSFPQVAAHMGRTLDSVKNFWLRGLAQLRRIVGDAP